MKVQNAIKIVLAVVVIFCGVELMYNTSETQNIEFFFDLCGAISLMSGVYLFGKVN